MRVSGRCYFSLSRANRLDCETAGNSNGQSLLGVRGWGQRHKADFLRRAGKSSRSGGEGRTAGWRGEDMETERLNRRESAEASARAPHLHTHLKDACCERSSCWTQRGHVYLLPWKYPLGLTTWQPTKIPTHQIFFQTYSNENLVFCVFDLVDI